MKQRLKLAAALVHDPRLLVLDEPTNGMDPSGRQEILELARDLAHGKEMSLLFSSHLLPDVEFVCDYVIVLGQGRLLAQGQIRDLKQGHEHCFEVRVKADAAGLWPPPGRIGLRRRGARSFPAGAASAGRVGKADLGGGRGIAANRSATCVRNKARWKKFS